MPGRTHNPQHPQAAGRGLTGQSLGAHLGHAVCRLQGGAGTGSCSREHSTASRPGLVWPLSIADVRSGCVSATPGNLEGPQGLCMISREPKLVSALPPQPKFSSMFIDVAQRAAPCPRGAAAQRRKEIGIGRKERRE